MTAVVAATGGVIIAVLISSGDQYEAYDHFVIFFVS